MNKVWLHVFLLSTLAVLIVCISESSVCAEDVDGEDADDEGDEVEQGGLLQRVMIRKHKKVPHRVKPITFPPTSGTMPPIQPTLPQATRPQPTLPQATRPQPTQPPPTQPPPTRPQATPPIITPPPVSGIVPTPSEFCIQCRQRLNQKAYYANPNDCHTFYQCFFYNETFATGILQQCPPFTFWSDDVLQCLQEGPVPCVDLCRDDAVAAVGCYGSPDNCAQFYVCSNGASAPFCCPPETRFEQASCSCIADLTCTATCTLPTPIPTVVAPATNNGTVCTDSFGVSMAAVPGDPTRFVVFDTADPANIISHTLTCALGSEFDLVACRCDVLTENVVSSPGRQCSLWLPFDTDLEDHSVERFLTYLIGSGSLDTSVAAHGSGSFAVDGGRLEIPGLKTFDFLKSASFCLAFRCQNGCSSSAGLFSSNKDSSGTDYSIIMATQPSNSFTGRMRFRAPVGSQAVNAPLNTPASGWNQACVTYDGTAMRLYLNGVAVVTEQTNGGSVAIAHCPYVVGTDQMFGNFNGNIDDVLVCPFTLTQEEINAHNQGNTAFLVSQGLIPSA